MYKSYSQELEEPLLAGSASKKTAPKPLSLIIAIVALACGVVALALAVTVMAGPASPGLAATTSARATVTSPTAATAPSSDYWSELGRLSGSVENMMHAMVLSQFQEEQIGRTTGNSGISECRSYGLGTKMYHQASFTNAGFMNIHNHADFKDTLGMGEWSAVLNGVHFTTRHNDYRLLMPSSTSTYHELVPVPLPGVPGRVRDAGKEHPMHSPAKVQAEVEEMRIWFKAFQTQNKKLRPYQNFFKPVISYLEGVWIQDEKLDEPFASDRHAIDAGSYAELYQKIRFLAQSGRKNILENLPALPTSIREVRYPTEIKARLNSMGVMKMNSYADSYTVAKTVYSSAKTRAEDNTVVVSIQDSGSLGVFLLVQIGTYAEGTKAGRMEFDVQCKGTGCESAYWAHCDDAGECKTLTKGSGLAKFSWTDKGMDGFLYGPFARTGCFELIVNTKRTSGSASVMLKSQKLNMKGVDNYYSRVSNAATNTIKFEACVMPAVPVIAKYEYRIATQPLGRDIPLNRFKMVTELSEMLAKGTPLTKAKLFTSRRARFKLNPKDQNAWYDGFQLEPQFIDALMAKIPGKDNHRKQPLYDVVDDMAAQTLGGKNLNVRYYSRMFKTDKTDAMGRTAMKRSFNDQNMWAARTTQAKVAGTTFRDDSKIKIQKWSWAIPLEIIYTTPLTNWNPWGVKYYGRDDPDARKAPFVGGHFGGKTKPLHAINYRTFYQTPAEFFTGGKVGDADDKADTSNGFKYVKDAKGVGRKMSASGHRITMRTIPGVPGIIRQRWPIAPVADSKSYAGREVEALKDIIFQGQSTFGGRVDDLIAEIAGSFKGVELETDMSAAAYKGGAHKHQLELSPADVKKMTDNPGKVYTFDTSQGDGHTHKIQVKRSIIKGKPTYVMVGCRPFGGGAFEAKCTDGHGKVNLA